MAHITEDRVAEKVTAPGSSAFTLPGSAITAHRTFGSVMSSTAPDTCFYTARAVDANGNDTGDWESGLGTYSASNTLTRTTIYESTNGNAAVNFASGDVIISITALSREFQMEPTVTLASDATSTSTTLASVSGMSFAGEANKTYIVEFFGVYQSAATTTGIGLALDIPSGSVAGFINGMSSATAMVGAEQIADNALTGNGTTGVRAANTDTPLYGMWIVVIGATPGTVQLMLRTEVSASQVTLKGSRCVLKARKMPG